MKPEVTRKCIKCGQDKPIDKYNYRTYGVNGDPIERRNDCNDCRYKETKQRAILKKQFEHIYPNETYACPICQRTEQELWTRKNNQYYAKGTKKSPWVLDHDHETGEFRGYICDYCNVGLSRFKDDVNILYRAIDYLKGALPYSVIVEKEKERVRGSNLNEFME